MTNEQWAQVAVQGMLQRVLQLVRLEYLRRAAELRR
jgi:hypothetical protein